MRSARFWLALAALVVAASLPSGLAEANFPRGIGQYRNACGAVSASQTWCVGTDGWTTFSGTVGTTGTACNTGTGSTWNGTCVVSVSNAGNDGTCKAEPLPAGFNAATFTPALPCASLSTAQGLLRNSKPDWLLLKRGDSWDGGFNGATSATWSKKGLSVNEPMLISSYGTGARPKIVLRKTSTNINCWGANSTNGQYLAITSIECYSAIADSSSGDYLASTLTGDTTSGGTTITNVTVPAWVQAGQNGAGYVVYGSGIAGLTATWSAGAPNTITVSGGTTSYTATGLTFQIYSKAISGTTGVNMNQPGGISAAQILNFFYVEDVMFRYAGFIQNVNAELTAENLVVRRNQFVSPWSGNSIFVGGTSTAPTSSEYILIEENVIDQGAASTDPTQWGGTGTPLIHCYYLHDPGAQYTFQRNIYSNCSTSAHQMREGATHYNNLSIGNGFNTTFIMSNYGTVSSYNVYDHPVDWRLGFRVATANSAAGVATTISYDGQTSRSGALVGSGVNVVNLSNPGSLPEWSVQGTATTTLSAASTASPTSVGLTFPSPYTTVQPGVRGDGVKIGDILQFTCCGYSVGIQVGAGGGLWVDSGPNNTFYAANSTVSFASGTPAVVTDTVGRGTDEIFQFTSGSPPAGTSLSTDYCTTNVNNTSKTYNYYPATAGTCPGVSSNAIAAATSPSGVGRQGSRKFTFATPPFTGYPQTPIPAWVTVGMSVCEYNRNQKPVQTAFSGTNGCSTVTWISSDRLSMFTADPVVVTFQGAGASVLIFDVPGNANNPSIRFGPNNLFLNAASVSKTGVGAAIETLAYANNFDLSGNYIYNWNYTTPASNIKNSLSPWANTNTVTQTLNVAADTTYPWASVDAYDASIAGVAFTGTLADNGNGGSTLTVSGGGGPAVGDILFAADGSNTVSQYMKVTSQTDATHWVTNKVQNVGPISMISGSYTHFITQALANSKGSWDSRYTANAANNFIRGARGIKCGDPVAYPGSAGCSQQNFLLKRDLDPASNDNSPMWLEKAA